MPVSNISSSLRVIKVLFYHIFISMGSFLEKKFAIVKNVKKRLNDCFIMLFQDNSKNLIVQKLFYLTTADHIHHTVSNLKKFYLNNLFYDHYSICIYHKMGALLLLDSKSL